MKLVPSCRRRARALAAALAAAPLLGACASAYDLTLMPRDSGKLSFGTAQDLGRGQAAVSITLGDKTYTGTWVATEAAPGVAYVGAGYGRWWGRGYDGAVVVDAASQDVVAKALLQAPDGAGLRCDLYGLNGGQGTGRCIDDKGLVYDVQIRLRN